MRARRCVISCCALVLMATSAAATPLDKRTTFTFSAPFSVPGATLPAGSYVFRLANQLSGRDVIQVLNADSGTAYAMFFSLRTPRGEPVDKPEIRFMETAEDMPVAIRSWWYPAETQGYEFVYPRQQALLLAKGTGTRVLTPGEGEADYAWIIPEQPAIEPAAPVAVPDEPTLIGEVAVAEETPIAGQEPTPVSLPRTDSPTATSILVGALALIAAIGVRAARLVRT